MNGSVNVLAVSGSDIYAGGSSTTAGGVSANYIAKWNGGVWSALGSGMNNTVSALAVSGNDIYAGGSSTTAGGVSANYIAKWNGGVWSALGSGMNNTVSALAVSGNDIYAGGSFTTAGGVSANYIAEWNGGVWSALGSGMNNTVSALAVSGSDIYAGGSFTTAGGVSANYIAKWNGGVWSALGSGMNNTVSALAVSGSDIYAGGSFTTAGGVSANYVAEWNGGVWSALGSGMNNTVSALAVSGSDIYAGGSFTTAAGVSANYVAKWNGGVWSALGSGMYNSGTPTTVYALAVSGTDVYAGGDFTSAGGVSASRIAKWNGSAWSALGSGLNNTVSALAVWASDAYAGGAFTTAGGVSASRIAKWNGSAWSALGSGLNNTVSALAASGTNLCAGGTFITAGNKVSAYAARAILPGEPRVTSQPVSATVVGGSTVSFHITAVGPEPLSYHWRKNGAMLFDGVQPSGATISGATTTNLTIANVQTNDEGGYSTLVFNVYDSVTSGVARLTVDLPAPPTIITQPQEQAVPVGTVVTFSVKATGIPPFQYQWRKNGTNLTDASQITGATSMSLSISGLQPGDAGTYSVVVSNIFGHAFSANAALTILPQPALDFEVWGGDSLPGSGDPSLGFTRLVRSADTTFSGNYLVYLFLASARCSMDAIQGSDGRYIGYNGYTGAANNVEDDRKWSLLGPPDGSLRTLLFPGSWFAFINPGNWTSITVLGPFPGLAPAIATQPESQTAVSGDTVTFTVAAQGLSPLSYQWRFSGTNVAGATNPSYTIGSVQGGNAGGYSVLVMNGYGSVASQVAMLTVTLAPVITTQPQSMAFRDGDNVCLSVTASGIPPMAYQWRKDSTNLVNGGRVSGAASAILCVSSAQASDIAGYSVVVTNAYGSVTSSVAVLTVAGPGQTFSLLDYYYPIYAGNQWVYDSRDNGSTWTTTCRILSAAFPFNCYSNCSPVVPYTRSAVPVLFDQGGGTTWTNFMQVGDAGFGYVGFDHVDGTRLRFGPGFIFTNRFALGQTVSVADETYFDGVCSGQGTQSIQLIGLADVTVPYGWFADCLHLQITSTIGAGTTVDEEWWAKGVGPVKWTHVGEGDFETNELRAVSFAEPVRLVDYYPLPLNAQWVYEGFDSDGNSAKSIRRVDATDTLIALCPALTNAVSEYNAYVNPTTMIPYDEWTEYMAAGNRFGYFGNSGAGDIRLDGGLILPEFMTVGSSETNAALACVGGTTVGSVTLTLQLMERTSVTVPAGEFPDVLRVRIALETPGGVEVHDEWWARSLGRIKEAGVSGDGVLERWELVEYSVPGPPAIIDQPESRTKSIGTTATFSVSAAGAAPLSYQWRKSGMNLVNGGNLSGVTTTNLMLTNIQTNNAGGYTVVVTNAYGSATSVVASLTVLPVAPPDNGLYFTNVTMTPDGRALFEVVTPSNGVYSLLVSTNLSDWISVENLEGPTNRFTVTWPDPPWRISDFRSLFLRAAVGLVPQFNFRLNLSDTAGILVAGTPSVTFPQSPHYSAFLEGNRLANPAADTNVFFTGPPGSGLTNALPEGTGLDPDHYGKNYWSPRPAAPSVPPPGRWTVKYAGTDLFFDQPDVQGRFVIPHPTVVVSNGVLVSVNWVYRDATTGQALGGPPAFMTGGAVEVYGGAPSQRLYDSDQLSRGTTNHTFAATLLWSEVNALDISYNDDLDNDYVIGYSK